MEMGRGGACVPARVALQGRIRRSSPAHNACIFGMETPLRGRSGGHAGTAPTVSFGWIMHGTVDFVCVGLRGKILRKWVGAVPVCPPVSPHKGASIVKIPAHNACASSMETPLRGRSGGHTGAAPTVPFGQIACGWLVSFGNGLCLAYAFRLYG